MNDIEKEAHGTDGSHITLRIEYDECPVNPRKEWDNAGTIWAWHRRYDLADEYCPDNPWNDEEMREHVGPGGVFLPVYMLDHSGITVSTGRFSCPWDSGQVGWVFMTEAKVKEEGLTKEQAIHLLECEVKTFAQYLEGDVYGYIVEVDGEEVESCWGFYGREYAIQDGMSAFNWFLAEHSRQGVLI